MIKKKERGIDSLHVVTMETKPNSGRINNTGIRDDGMRCSKDWLKPVPHWMRGVSGETFIEVPKLYILLANREAVTVDLLDTRVMIQNR